MIPPRVLCFITPRNLGDITLGSTFFRELAACEYADEYIVWTRPGTAFLFDDIPGCRVVMSNFPIGTSKNFGAAAALQLIRSVREIRRLRPTLTMDLTGDFRERFLGRLIGPQPHLHPGWAENHSFKRMNRNPFGEGTPTVVVPANVTNVYDSHRLLLEHLVGARRPCRTGKTTAPDAQPSPTFAIGLHPFASQACRLWPEESWTQLAAQLLDSGAIVSAFGAPSERSKLEALFGNLGGRVRLVTESLPDFAAALSRLDLLVGLDSFSIHMAENVGTATVFINGANNPALFSPPHAEVVASSGGCTAWPCYNKPTCVGGASEYACIRSIDVDRVRDAIRAKLKDRGAERMGQS